MTITKRLVVDLADIQALRIVCQTCKAVLSLSLTETVRVPPTCPNCHADWDEAQSGLQRRSVDQLAQALKAPPANGKRFLVQLEFPAE
jgi:hypothetical protein